MTKENFDKIIERVKKLFALSSSSNEHEASLAIQRAKELMFKYNVEETDLCDVEDIIELDLTLSNRFNIYQTTLAVHVANVFSMKAIIVKTKTGYHKIENKIRFIASTSDMAVGTYVYSYLLNIIEQKSKEYFESIRYSKEKWTPSNSKKIKADWSYGFVNGVSQNLKKMQAEKEVLNPYEMVQEKALVIVKNAKIDDYIKEKMGKTKTVKNKINFDKDSYMSGHSAGEKQGIFRGVGGNTNQLQIGA